MDNQNITAKLVITGGGHNTFTTTYTGELGYLGVVSWLENELKEIKQRVLIPKACSLCGKWIETERVMQGKKLCSKCELREGAE